MSFRDDVLGWKTGHYPGITTYDGVITGWPPGAPFPEPDQATHDVWEAEYVAVLSARRAVDAERVTLPELIDALRGRGVITAADLDAVRGTKP